MSSLISVVCGSTISCVAKAAFIWRRSVTGMRPGCNPHGIIESQICSNTHVVYYIGFTCTGRINNDSNRQELDRYTRSKAPSHRACLSFIPSLSPRHMHALANVLKSSYEMCVHLQTRARRHEHRTI